MRLTANRQLARTLRISGSIFVPTCLNVLYNDIFTSVIDLGVKDSLSIVGSTEMQKYIYIHIHKYEGRTESHEQQFFVK